MTVQEILGRFGSAKASGGQFLVRCCAHEDKSPSLAIKEGTDGSILLKCHAGCTTDAILAALNLTPADLFPAKDSSPAKIIQAVYPYHDESDKLEFQAIRYSPKGFTQRRPDGNGGWIYNLQGIRRIVYRLPELLGQQAILWLEGEKDVDAAWKLGIPATCNPMGAGKWAPEYARMLVTQGVKRVAVIPDNDPPGAAHGLTVATGLQLVGLEVRLVTLPNLPDHGDLSDYLSTGKTKDDLLQLVRSTPLWIKPAAIIVPVSVDVPPRHFQELGEQKYTLTIQPEGVVMEVNRLRRSSQELHGELLVRVNGHFPNARTFGDGILQVGDMNFSSTTTRTSRAKLLGDRAGDKNFDWYGILEEFITGVIAAERRGKPAEVLADSEPEDEENSDAWTIEGFPILRQLPSVIFGDGACGKSYFAMWIAGKLAEMGIPVLYADWEFSKAEHQKRLRRLFRPMPKLLYYIRCDHSLKQEADHLLDIVQKHKIQYIICDSIGFAVEGAAEHQESAAGYFRYLRQLRVGSLNVAHIPKQTDDSKEATVFGSAFFKYGARSVWFVDRARENPNGEIRFGLYHRKSNIGALLQPKGFKLTFRGEVTSMEAINLKDVEELAAGFPLLDRIKELLTPGPQTVKGISEELNVTVPMVKSTLARHRSQFQKIGNRVAVKDLTAPAPETKDEGSTDF